MRLDTVVFVFAVLIFTAPYAHSAEIGPGGTPGCLLKLDGPIEAGTVTSSRPRSIPLARLVVSTAAK
jgi:hypothetical protein